MLVLRDAREGSYPCRRVYARRTDETVFKRVEGFDDKSYVSEVLSASEEPHLYVNVFDRGILTAKATSGGKSTAVSLGFSWKGTFIVPLPYGKARQIRVNDPTMEREERIWIRSLVGLGEQKAILVIYAKERKATAQEAAKVPKQFRKLIQSDKGRYVDQYVGALDPNTGILRMITKLKTPLF